MAEERISTERVKENSAQNRFELEIDGYLAYLEYRLDERYMDLFHTFSPKALSGRGVASLLVAFALNQARERKLNVKPTCSFVESYIKNHPEFLDLIG